MVDRAVDCGMVIIQSVHYFRSPGYSKKRPQVPVRKSSKDVRGNKCDTPLVSFFCGARRPADFSLTSNIGHTIWHGISRISKNFSEFRTDFQNFRENFKLSKKFLEISLYDQSLSLETKVGKDRDSERRLVAYHIYFHGHPRLPPQHGLLLLLHSCWVNVRCCYIPAE